MRSFIIMKIVRMRAVFIVIALRATKPVQSPKKWCVTRVEKQGKQKRETEFSLSRTTSVFRVFKLFKLHVVLICLPPLPPFSV